MKKAGVLSVLMMFGMMSNASALFVDPVSASLVAGYGLGVATVSAGNYFFGKGNVATLKAGGCGFTGANEYYPIGNGQCVECDSGQGNAPNGTVAYYFNGSFPVQSRQCHDHTHWGARGNVRECKTPCNAEPGWSGVPLPGTTRFIMCVKSNQQFQTLGDSIFTSGGGNCYWDTTKTPKKPETNSKCATQSGNAKTNDVVSGSCSDESGVASKLTSKEHIKAGAQCSFKCTTNGWSASLKNDSCESGYEPSQDKKQCVTTVAGNMCRFTGGEWNTGIQQCTCPPSKKLTNDGPDKCKCSQSGYEWDYEKTECVNAAGRTYSQQTVVNTNNYNAGLRKKACTDSGGTMSGSSCVCDAAKFMVASSGVCTCMSGYELISPSEGCKVTPTETLKRACDAATNADWNATTQKCVCKDEDYELIVDAQTCKPIPALAECQPLMSKNKARWDTTSKTCSCTQAGYAIVNGDCVETEEAATARKDKEMKSAKNKIEDVHSKLKRVQDGFKVSAWKNEEGKFNTARLASDSIAGVVLGTAGGLVTSKVVKKNQVENGFEDIQCTIGGQAVAQWGDDFSVGTQF